MRVQFGNPNPVEGDDHIPVERDGPCVTYVEGLNGSAFDPDLDLSDFKGKLLDALTQRQGVINMPNSGDILAMVHPAGVMANHAGAPPSWIWSDNEEFAQLLGRYYECPVGLPEDVEDTHFTLAGPPGVGGSVVDMQMNTTQNGRDIIARSLGGVVGATGKGSGCTATVLTTASTYTTNQWAGYLCVVADTTNSQCVYGLIQSNTNTSSASTVTVDRWYNAATPSGSSSSGVGAAATTPAAGYEFIILSNAAPAFFVGISASSTAPATPDTHTTLTSEITTGSGGLIRTGIGAGVVVAHSASAATWTLTCTFTANGSDSLPVTIASYGVFNSAVVTDVPNMLSYNTISPTATISASGDVLTLTVTYTTS